MVISLQVQRQQHFNKVAVFTEEKYAKDNMDSSADVGA